MALEETGMGILEDKTIKNNSASEFIFKNFGDIRICGILKVGNLITRLDELRK